MNFFSQLSPLAIAGIKWRMTVSQTGDQMQVDIIPEVAAGKSGISIPPQALIGTPSELDEAFTGFLTNYVSAGTNLNDQIAVANAVMGQALVQAQETVAQAAGKVKKPTTGSPAVAKPGVAKDKTAGGFMDIDEDDDKADQAGGAGALVQGPDSSSAVPGLGETPAPDDKNLFLF